MFLLKDELRGQRISSSLAKWAVGKASFPWNLHLLRWETDPLTFLIWT